MPRSDFQSIAEILQRMLVVERTVKYIRQEFESRGYSWYAVRQAGRRLGVMKHNHGQGSDWYWYLPKDSEE